jgi:hypothetical protein
MTQVTPIRDLKAYLSPEQVERLIAVATNPRDVLLIRIPWRTGIRVGELIRLRIPDIDFDSRSREERGTRSRLKSQGWYPSTGAHWTWSESTYNGENSFLTRGTCSSPSLGSGFAKSSGKWGKKLA